MMANDQTDDEFEAAALALLEGAVDPLDDEDLASIGIDVADFGEPSAKRRRVEPEFVGEDIVFTKFSAPFGGFSNFAETPISVGDKEFPTTEHAFQYYKMSCINTPGSLEQAEKILLATTPTKAKALASKKGFAMTSSQIDYWDKNRVEIMESLIAIKFKPNSDMAGLLLLTQDRQIIEKAPWDCFWGSGRTGNGKNILGKILMNQRYYLQHVVGNGYSGRLDFARVILLE